MWNRRDFQNSPARSLDPEIDVEWKVGTPADGTYNAMPNGNVDDSTTSGASFGMSASEPVEAIPAGDDVLLAVRHIGEGEEGQRRGVVEMLNWQVDGSAPERSCVGADRKPARTSLRGRTGLSVSAGRVGLSRKLSRVAVRTGPDRILDSRTDSTAVRRFRLLHQ